MQTSLDIIGAKENLLGHSDAITSICACRPYSIVVTGSKDSLAIVWDLNRYMPFLVSLVNIRCYVIVEFLGSREKGLSQMKWRH